MCDLFFDMMEETRRREEEKARYCGDAMGLFHGDGRGCRVTFLSCELLWKKRIIMLTMINILY